MWENAKYGWYTSLLIDLDKIPTREVFAEAVKGAWAATTGANLQQWAVACEMHASSDKTTANIFHYHMAVKLEKRARWLSVRNFFDEIMVLRWISAQTTTPITLHLSTLLKRTQNAFCPKDTLTCRTATHREPNKPFREENERLVRRQVGLQRKEESEISPFMMLCDLYSPKK